MTSELFLYFMIIHIIGDYYLQSETLSIEKNSKYSKVLLHGLIYFLISQVLIIPIWSLQMMIYASIFSMIHMFIDFIKYFVYMIANKSKVDKLAKFLKVQIDKGSIYIFDQIFHIITIYILCYLIDYNNSFINVIDLFNMVTIPKTSILRIVLMFLLILKPVNVTFKMLLNNKKPVDDVDGDYIEDKNTGKIIGCLERMLVLIMLLVNQYTAIGLIFTAKSITRYDKISKNKQFAEYYLIGTLFSMLSTIIIFIFVSNI